MSYQEKPEQKTECYVATNWYTNMRDTCADNFATCDGEIEVGFGHGSDNVVVCDKYDGKSRESIKI